MNSMDFLKDYQLVWSDDFKGNELDPKKWSLVNHMRAQEDLKIFADERAVFVKDGKVTLRVDRIDENNYSANSSLTTSETMIFKYGYVEMRAKIPFGDSTWPGFWLKSSRYNRFDPHIGAEIDIFEVFAKPTELKPNLHKWYDDGSGEHYMLTNDITGKFNFESRTEAEDWHIYGMLWTEKAISFTIDGETYSTIDITDTGDFGNRGDGMSCFHDYFYLIMNNYLMTEKGYKLGPPANADTVFPKDYVIDYVCLYQKKDEGDLILLNK